MIKFVVYTRDTRIHDVDYVFEDCEKLLKLIPYLKKKIEGKWEIAVIEPSIQYARKFADNDIIPEYVTVTFYMERTVAEQLLTERPNLAVKNKSAYEKYMDLIADLKVIIDPDAAKELYRRVGTSKDKLPEYLSELSEQAQSGAITVNMVRNQVADERKMYASNVIDAFLMKDRWRWKKYDKLVADLGRSYAFYAMRKYVTKLLREKNNYLRNQPTTIRNIDKIDGFRICHAYVLFTEATAVELDACMRSLDNRDLLRRVYVNN